MWKWLRKTAQSLGLAASIALPSVASSCAPTEGINVDLHNKSVRLTVIHTSDIHSRIFPYQYTPLLPDRNAGLQLGKGPYGGMARVTHVVRRERARADRSLHIDGGDIFQGAPIFNYYSGEAELRALSETGVDAMVIANHEFDRGVVNVATQIQKWATFPVLAANYWTEDPSFPGTSPINSVLRPYTILNVRGLRVAVVGMANLSTLSSIFEQPNRLGILPFKTRDIAQFWVDFLRPQSDLVVFVTHLGLESDEEMIKHTEGIDIVLGGHNHIVVAPPKQVFDCGGTETEQGYVEIPNADGVLEKRYCKPRRVLLMHSGAFAKFVGRLDVELTDNAEVIDRNVGRPGFYDPVNKFEVVAHEMQIFPIDVDVAEDRRMAAMLEPYKFALRDIGNLDLLVGYAPADVRRTASSGGDSQLGNLIATSMWMRLGVQTDFSMTNTTGIRADLPKGPVTLENMFNVFPFDNSITKMQLSGGEILELFDFVARRSKLRGCTSQVQIAGAHLVINCSSCDPKFRPDVVGVDACAEQLFIGFTDKTCEQDKDCGPTEELSRFACDKRVRKCRNPVQRNGSYELATSNYLAGGGSGFRVLQRNTTQFDTKIQQRDAATDFVRIGKPCGWQTTADGTGGLLQCSTDAECTPLGDYVCACPEAVEVSVGPDVSPLACATKKGATCGGLGRCVLADCRNDVAAFHDSSDCTESSGDAKVKCRASACSQAGEQCKLLACVDATIGALVDGRQVMLGR
ncbi:MAG: bifunctional metallophosphatase/5'-nucleotidase [Deltaproteobacteria bacterium]|nr:bifunctional metallophosphatase/5'-nucleotidase [Deltaproteobacteria bacterium]